MVPIYPRYYGFFELEHDNKWPIVILAFAGSGIAGGLLRLAQWET